MSGQLMETPVTKLVDVVMETENEIKASGFNLTEGEQDIFVKETLQDSPTTKRHRLQKAVTSLDFKGSKAKMKKMSIKSIKPFKAKKRRFHLKPFKESKQSVDTKDFRPMNVEFTLPKVQKQQKTGKSTFEQRSEHSRLTAMGHIEKKKIPFTGVIKKETRHDDKEGHLPRPRITIKVKTLKIRSTLKKKNTFHGKTPSESKYRIPTVELHVKRTPGKIVKLKNKTKGGCRGKCKPPKVELSLAVPSRTAGKEVKDKNVRHASKKPKGFGFQIDIPNVGFSDPKRDAQQFHESRKVTPKKAKLHFPHLELSHLSNVKERTGKKDFLLGKTRVPLIEVTAPKLDLGLIFTRKEQIDTNTGGSPRHTGLGSLPKVSLTSKSIEDANHLNNFSTARHEDEEMFKGNKLPAFNITIPAPDIDLHFSKLTERKRGKVNQGKELGNKGMKKTFEFPLKMSEIAIKRLNYPTKDEKIFTGSKISLPKCDLIQAVSSGYHMMGQEKSETHDIPQIDIYFPKISEHNIKGNKEECKESKLTVPILDISLPRIKWPEAELGVEEHRVGKFQIPAFQLSLPKIKSEAVDVVSKGNKSDKTHIPHIDIYLKKLISPQTEVAGEKHERKDSKVKIPIFDISIPQLKVPGTKIKSKTFDRKCGSFFPEIDISSPLQSMQRDAEKQRSDRAHLPICDVALPRITVTDDEEHRINKSKTDILFPKRKLSKTDKNESSVTCDKLQMPNIDFSFPQIMVPKADDNDEDKNRPAFDISLPFIKLPKVDIGAKTIRIPQMNIFLPKNKLPDVEVNTKGIGAIGSKFHIPTLHMSFTKINSKDNWPQSQSPKINIPKLDVCLLNVKSGKSGVKIGDSSSNRQIPKLGIVMPKVEQCSNVGPVSDHNTKKVDKSLVLAPVTIPRINVEIPKFQPKPRDNGNDYGSLNIPEIHLKIPKMSISKIGAKPLNAEINVDEFLKEKTKGKRDIQFMGFPKEKHSPKASKHGELKTRKCDHEPEVKLKLPTIAMPKINVSTSPLSDIDLELKIPREADPSDVSRTSFSFKSPAVKLPKFPTRDINKAFQSSKLLQSLKSKEGTRANIKLPDVKCPAIHINTPKMKLGKEMVRVSSRAQTELFKAKGQRPSSAARFDILDVSLKMPQF